MSLFSSHSGNQLIHTLETRIDSLISLGEDISKLTNTSENRTLLKWSMPLTTDGAEYTFNLGTIPPSSIQGPNSIQYFDTNTGVIATSGSYMFWLKLHTVDSYSDLNMNLAVKLEDDTLVQKGCKLTSPLDYFRTEPSGESDDYYTYKHLIHQKVQF